MLAKIVLCQEEIIMVQDDDGDSCGSPDENSLVGGCL